MEIFVSTTAPQEDTAMQIVTSRKTETIGRKPQIVVADSQIICKVILF